MQAVSRNAKAIGPVFGGARAKPVDQRDGGGAGGQGEAGAGAGGDGAGAIAVGAGFGVGLGFFATGFLRAGGGAAGCSSTKTGLGTSRGSVPGLFGSRGSCGATIRTGMVCD